MTELDHYEWVGAMWCENTQTVLGPFEEYDGGECPECGQRLDENDDET